ncbi:MAG TPA: di-heme oxidoredictase family protein [Terriglobales bacterium]|nr:di-heme oxidoredictase family protein [Terriglobales bacterium]
MKSPNASLMMKASFVLVTLVVAAGFLTNLGQIQPAHVNAQTTLGGPIPGLTSGQMTHFTIGQTQFNFPWDPVHGLGPVFTQDKCNFCHIKTATAGPVSGGFNGSSQFFNTFFGTLNSDGSFNPLTNEGGPLLQKGTVQKFIPGCPLPGEIVPVDATIVAKHMPPPLFGDGLIDSIDDNAILANVGSKGMGINSVANMVADYTGVTRVGRFGLKAQFASLLQISAEAFGHDIGITNPISTQEDLPQGKQYPLSCVKRSQLNDPQGAETVQIFDFLVYLAPVTPGAGNSNGQALFSTVGCALCHNPTYTTDPAVMIPSDLAGHFNGPITALSGQTVSLYSDLLLHDMGTALSDKIPQGLASGSQWRTAPLWGLSQRTVFLHDGRAKDLNTAIQDHGGEATQVIQTFNALSPSDQADLIAFISSL